VRPRLSSYQSAPADGPPLGGGDRRRSSGLTPKGKSLPSGERHLQAVEVPSRHRACRIEDAAHVYTAPGAAVAQLARASACHAEGRGFESLQPLPRSPCKHVRLRLRRSVDAPFLTLMEARWKPSPVAEPPLPTIAGLLASSGAAARQAKDHISDRAIPLDRPAFTPDLVTVWMAVAKSGVPQPEAALEPRERLASCRSRRL
jgi:hypothetical protein